MFGSRRWMSAVVAGTAVSLVALAGCAAGEIGSDNATSGSGGGSASGSSTATESVVQDAATFLAGRAAELGTDSINVLAQSSPQANAVQALSQQFTDSTGITVNWTILDEQSTENRAAVALGSSAGGYDVIQTPSAWIPTYVDRGWIESIDSLVSNQADAVPGWDKSAFGEGTNALLSRGGTLYGVPMFIGTQVIYYRTDVFEAHGIKAPPTTWKELVDDVKKIDGNDVRGIALRTAPSISQLLFVWSAWLYAYGGSYYESYQDGTYSGVALNSPEAVEALTDFADLVQNHAPSGATNWSVDDVTRAFMAGRVAMVQEGAVFGATFNDPNTSQVAGKVDSFVLPAGPAGTFVPYNTHGWTIAANSKATDAAWLFVQWATLKDTLTAATQGEAGFSTPPLADVYSSPEYAERFGFGNFVNSVVGTIEAANDGGVSPLEGDPNYQPATTDWATTGQVISEELSKAVTGQEPPADAIANAAKALG